ncbi:Zn-ribbon domain-containing OB-fold protein [Chloroflexota bacterium]
MEELPKFGGKHSFAMLWRFNAEWYRLIGSKCRKCGTVHYPRRQLCVYPCDSHDMEDVQLSHTGKIRYGGLNPGGLEGYGDVQPQVFATIKLDNGPHLNAEIVNLPLSFIRKCALNRKELKIIADRKVRMVIRRFRKHDNGDITYGHKFELVERLEEEK